MGANQTVPGVDTIRFGIPSLDELFGGKAGEAHWAGIDVPGMGKGTGGTTIAIMGQDGTGKSVLALHLASRYMTDCLCAAGRGIPQVLYVSTDLSCERAGEIWDCFGLARNNLREVPFCQPMMGGAGGEVQDPEAWVELKKTEPLGVAGSLGGGAAKKAKRYKLKGPAPEGEVRFIDLALDTAGDDWGFLTRLVSTLATPGANDPKHLVVVDAVEGLELLAGERDAFGEPVTRRGRLAQLVRAAGTKCHLVFVVEALNARSQPEQYVSDVVIHLRNRKEGGYNRRTLEIEKARSMPHARGQHPYFIRDGSGSTTGSRENIDDPEAANGYVVVLPSLSLLSRRLMFDSASKVLPDVPVDRYLGFGVTHLDELLSKHGGERTLTRYQDSAGFRAGSQNLLFGDVQTYKSRLARGFLFRGFYHFAERLLDIAKELNGTAEDRPALLHVVGECLMASRRRAVEDALRGAGEGKPKALAEAYGCAEADLPTNLATRLRGRQREGGEAAEDELQYLLGVYERYLPRKWRERALELGGAYKEEFGVAMAGTTLATGEVLEGLCSLLLACERREFEGAASAALPQDGEQGNGVGTGLGQWLERWHGYALKGTAEKIGAVLKEIETKLVKASRRFVSGTETVLDGSAASMAWTLYLASPATHPYTDQKTVTELCATFLRRGGRRSGAVRRGEVLTLTVLQSAMRQGWRTGRLERDLGCYSARDESKARRWATRDADGFMAWVTCLKIKGQAGGRAGGYGFEGLAKWLTVGGAPWGEAEPKNKNKAKQLERWLGREQHLEMSRASGKVTAGAPERNLYRASWLLERSLHLNCEDAPALLITTEDSSTDKLESEFAELIGELAKKAAGADGGGVWQRLVLNHFRRWMICRRMEVHAMTAPVIFHFLRRNLEVCQRIALGHQFLNRENASRAEQSWPIRVVIDDLTAFRETYPEVEKDPLFLPFVGSYLRREGVTALLVATQEGRPDREAQTRFDQQVRLQFSQGEVRTWHVPFFGENRIAVTTGGAARPENALIREVRRQAGRFLPVVDPHFELYAGLEKGAPQPAPLEVRLYGETSQFAAHVARENQLFGDVFTALRGPNGEVRPMIEAVEGDDLERLRDFGQLRHDTQMMSTLVFQVDEHWALSRTSGLRPTWEYLNAVCGGADRHVNEANDPFRLFRRVEGDRARMNQAAALNRRRGRFDWRGYELEEELKGEAASQKLRTARLDRVPYMWNFGFLMCDEDAWVAAGKLPLMRLARTEEETPPYKAVEDVWRQLRVVKRGEPGRQDVAQEPVPWRVFLEACKMVASNETQRGVAEAWPFDLALHATESLSCLVFEMWLSEIRKLEPNAERLKLKVGKTPILERLKHRSWEPQQGLGILDLLMPGDGSVPRGKQDIETENGVRLAGHWYPGFSLELYKVFLLLRESLNFDSLFETPRSRVLRHRPALVSAVATRQWYNTSADYQTDSGPDRNLRVVRLPGHFSTRGDWYLVTAQGSYSPRLADRAFDLLNSRRANITRMYLGLGLPVRDLIANGAEGTPENDRYQTALYHRATETGGRSFVEPLQYGDLQWAGVVPGKGEEKFSWFWRSALGHYDSHCRIWQKWLVRQLQWWNTLRHRQDTGWEGGFETYDQIEGLRRRVVAAGGNEASYLGGLESFKSFPDHCKYLVAELKEATPSGEGGGEAE